jgi:hypothetical protein
MPYVLWAAAVFLIVFISYGLWWGLLALAVVVVFQVIGAHRGWFVTRGYTRNSR